MEQDLVSYGRPSGPGEVEAFGRLCAEGFGFPAADAPAWIASAGPDAVRALRRGDALAGGLINLPMGQYWGGRAVRMLGYAGVAVAPAFRGTGLATKLMGEALAEARREGYPLAGLYPATQPLYRRVGFEQAGLRYETRGPIQALPSSPRRLAARAYEPADLPAVQRLYAEVARARPGWLDRGPYVWTRVFHPRGKTAHGYLFGEGERPEAYVVLARVLKPTGNQELFLTDLVSRTAEGARRVLTFLCDHGSLADEVTWNAAPGDPLLQLLPEQRFTSRTLMSWMIRLLDVPAALGARGYPRALSAQLALEVEDPLFAENAGRLTLSVSGGEGRAVPGGQGALRCDVRALATIYAGFRSASELARVGVVTGSSEALEAADEIFAGPAPSMPDMF